MFDRFTMDSRKVMKAARNEAAISSDYISTRHLLLGLSQVEGESKKALDRVGLTTDKLKAESKKYDEGNKLCVGVIPFTRNAKEVLEKAVEIAAFQKDNHISPSHLLTGLCRIKGTSAQKVARALATEEEIAKIIKDYEEAQIGQRVVAPQQEKCEGCQEEPATHADDYGVNLCQGCYEISEVPEPYQSPFTGEWV